MDSAKTVADWMADREISIEQLLESTALDQRVLKAIIKGQYTASPQQRQRLAAALNVDVAEIAWGHTTQVQHIYGHGPQFGRSP
jgi:hypothetical protein